MADPTRRLPDPDDEPGGRPSEPTRPLPGRPEPDRDLPVAVAAGGLLVFLLLLTVLVHPAAFTGLVGLLVLIGLLEAGRVLRERAVVVSTPVLLVAALVLLVGAYRLGPAGQAVGLVTLLAGAVVWELADHDRDDVFAKVAATVLLGLWVPFLGTYAVLLVTRPDGWVAALATVGVAVVSDIAAYFVGTRFGRTKLAPRISPGKTWEGLAGGIGLTTLVAVAVLPFLGGTFTWWGAVVFTVVVAGAGVVGDLTESLLKRDLGVKDFGGVIPGHGGVLDRVDAVLFALPAGYYTLTVLGG
jgi:phosphatidate cytidylyltransferase